MYKTKEVCILSTNNINKILPLLIDRLGMVFGDVCHYIIPGGDY